MGRDVTDSDGGRRTETVAPTENTVAKVKLLSENVIRKIAAGEVVEGPSSVVKELVENSLDAGATRIKINLVEGGIQQIEIADNGSGMIRQDVILAVERHATSKIEAPSDLFGITSLGFRGEALASIAAVSRMWIETHPGGGDQGTRLAIDGGVQRELRSCARDVGTTISVRGLFFNTPARRKFLKKVSTETRNATRTIMHLAAAYPQVGFEMVHQDHKGLSFLPGARLERTGELLGLSPSGLLEAVQEDGDLQVHAVVCAPENSRRSKGGQYAVVRERPVHSRTLNQAVYDGYSGLLRDEHPLFALWLKLPAQQVDVNVHPAKREVRFVDEERCAKAVTAAVRKALQMPDAFASAVPATASPSAEGFRVGEAKIDFTTQRPTPAPEQITANLVPPTPVKGRALIPATLEGRNRVREELRGRDNAWQLHRRYLLMPTDDGIVIIDQNLAHQRILYERALGLFASENRPSQHLLLPLTLDLEASEMELAVRARIPLGNLGFQVREFGASAVIIDSVPPDLPDWDHAELFRQLLNDCGAEESAEETLRDNIAIAFAARTAIQVGQDLHKEEVKTLIGQLFETNEPFRAPQGPPTMAKLSLAEIERLFKS